MTRLIACACTVFLTAFILPVSNQTYAQLFHAESGEQKMRDGSIWTLSIKEVERLPRVSVVEIISTGRLHAISSSMFTGCTIVALARERGWHYVAQTKKMTLMRIGSLEKLSDDPATVLGEEFIGVNAKTNLDIDRFGWGCDVISREAAAAAKN